MKADATTTTTASLSGSASVDRSLTHHDRTLPARFTLVPDSEIKNKWVNVKLFVTDHGRLWKHPETGEIIDAAEMSTRFPEGLAEAQERLRRNPHLGIRLSFTAGLKRIYQLFHSKKAVSRCFTAVFHEWLQKQMEENAGKGEQSEGNPYRKLSQ